MDAYYRQRLYGNVVFFGFCIVVFAILCKIADAIVHRETDRNGYICVSSYLRNNPSPELRYKIEEALKDNKLTEYELREIISYSRDEKEREDAGKAKKEALEAIKKKE